MKKPASKVAHNRPKFYFFINANWPKSSPNLPPRDFSIMTLIMTMYLFGISFSDGDYLFLILEPFHRFWKIMWLNDYFWRTMKKVAYDFYHGGSFYTVKSNMKWKRLSLKQQRGWRVALHSVFTEQFSPLAFPFILFYEQPLKQRNQNAWNSITVINPY